MGDKRIRRLAHDYVTNDVIPCLHPSPVDLQVYRNIVFDRFGNAALADTNERVCVDSYSKIRGFIAPTVCERLARNESIAGVAILPALFLAKRQSEAHPAAASTQVAAGAEILRSTRSTRAPIQCGRFAWIRCCGEAAPEMKGCWVPCAKQRDASRNCCRVKATES